MKTKALLFCGMLASIVYVGTVFLGGLLRPGYSHKAQAVSELIATGAPNKSLLDPLFALYNLLTLAFGLGLFWRVQREKDNPRRKAGLAAALFLIAEAVFGFITVFFPQDPRGAPSTPTGVMHIVLAGLTAVTSLLTIGLMGFWFKATSNLRAFGVYSFVSALVVLLSGGLSAALAASNSPVMGLFERVVIGGFAQWLFVIGYVLYASEKSEAEHE